MKIFRPFRWLKRDGRSISPITRRILAVNLLAVGLLAAGMLYLGQYRVELIQSEHKALLTQGDVFAAALGEGAVSREGQDLLIDVTKQMIRRLHETTGTRARLFTAEGTLVADSRVLLGSGGSVQVEVLPPPQPDPSLTQGALRLYNRFFELISGQGDYPTVSGGPILDGREYQEVAFALVGEASVGVRAIEDSRQLLISVAVPVRRYKQVLGALLLTKDSREIEQAVYQVQLAVLQVSGVAFGITILLSFYLAGTIAQPIRRLARAAEKIRKSSGREQIIPEFSKRNDEIGELSVALKEMTEALWLRMDAIESFAADVSHEIKNPLTSLRSAVETAVRIQDPEQQKKLMGIILEDVQRLDRLISDISDASRLDAELSRGQMEQVSLVPMLNMLKDAYQAQADQRQVVLKIDADNSQALKVNAIEGRLAQVFRNLISNALSFSPAGGSVTVRAETIGRDIRIIVDDEGPGLPDGAEEKIFKRFYTHRPNGEKFGKHSGLGLSISQQIIASHNGDLIAENRNPVDNGTPGARFIVTLPSIDPVKNRR